MEEFVQIADWPSYYVNKDGDVRNASGLMLKEATHNGCVGHKLKKDGRGRVFSKRILALAYEYGSIDAIPREMRKPGKSKPKHDAEICQLFDCGMSVDDIAVALGIHHHTVCDGLKRCGKSARQRRLEQEHTRKENRLREKQRAAEIRECERLVNSTQLTFSFKSCPTCGALFVGIGTYCCEECRPSAYKHHDYEHAEHRCPKCGVTVIGGKSHRLCPACKRESLRAGNKGTLAHRARKATRETGAEYQPGITLEKVYERDGGICWICGNPTDLSDRRWGPCGPNYPSVDHVVPLAKGGSHTWANVKLAHHKCNSVKSDHLIESA